MGNTERASRRARGDDEIDEWIRRRFRSCVTMPLFPEPQPRRTPGFFEMSDIGPQLRLLGQAERAQSRGR